jgi:hypothetical protein
MDNPHYVTPEEAEKKYCPLKYSDCIGPKCMAWRWQELVEDFVKVSGSEIGPIEKVVKGYSTTHGYCGMVRS